MNPRKYKDQTAPAASDTTVKPSATVGLQRFASQERLICSLLLLCYRIPPTVIRLEPTTDKQTKTVSDEQSRNNRRLYTTPA